MEDKQKLYEERLARYQAAIALEPTDRMLIGGAGTNSFAWAYAGYSQQEIMYEDDKWIASMSKFAEDFPEIDVLRSGRRAWPPLLDAIGCTLYRLPGRDLPPDVGFQYNERVFMRPEEYDLLINQPANFYIEHFLPLIFDECKERGSPRSYMAFLKGGMASVMADQVVANWSRYMKEKYGLPSPVRGVALAPFDCIADKLRGFEGIMIDIHERPEKVLEACDALVPDIVNCALADADPDRRLPILMPLHRGCHPFLSPKQFDTFYWPTLKRVTEMLIQAGYTCRVYLEGDWTPNLHHYAEFPKGKILCDLDNKADILRAKKEIGDKCCIAGGIQDSMFILGSPDDIRARVKYLCETVKDGGLIITGGCDYPYLTKPENFKAMVDAIMDYGKYTDEVLNLKEPAKQSDYTLPLNIEKVITPWDVKLKEMGGVLGEEASISRVWDMMEKKAYRWLFSWIEI